ncbi:Phage phi-C31 major capsid gp36-like protein [Pseudorhizobium banfieldiae]|uniref:Phage phi-C31 major capsid gp36-like protein n=1 Tax=Pseudorhizobium banfieldiae TaxID=1125847 RepID=L0NCT7_9HYPH|nr:phage major capsid protein [Pseudorhizobium banfieldiae]CAD6603118.1 phage major capsid protein [arsenite-oxidising bacterium NT-25]CAD6608910.1 phage major capsid protein [Rhizobium sp. TCK]CCF18621.1 Phage phi-C31 major capsid gp36-like protein [Pseudorhizobium banfieldiae]
MTDMTKTAPEVKAPEIKGVPETVTAAFDEFMEAFEAFKDVNDRRLGEIEQKLSADVVTRDKMDRINRAMDEQKKVLDQMLLKKARPALGSSQGRELSPEAEEHKAAFDAYVRRGDEAGLRELEAKAFSATAGADGGYLVPPETDNEIGRRVSIVSPMRALSTVRTVSTSVLKKPFATAGLSTGWVAETAARPQTNTPQLAELSFPTMELYAMPAATQALLDDAAVDIEAWIAGEVDIVFAEQEGDAFIRGDGVNKPKGFLTYTAVAESVWTWGNLGYIATGAAGAWKTTGPSDTLVDVIYALKAGHRQNGTFMMNRKTQADVRKFKDADGNYLWRPPASAGQPASLMGFPIAEAEEMPDVGANALAVAFGDFRSGYLVVDRAGVRILRDPYSAKPYVLFYTTKRVGGGVQNFEAIKLVKFAAS